MRADDAQTAEEAFMAITYYVALPFIRTDDGTAPGVFQQISLAARATLGRERQARCP